MYSEHTAVVSAGIQLVNSLLYTYVSRDELARIEGSRSLPSSNLSYAAGSLRSTLEDSVHNGLRPA
jgi:hypothetical protein